MDGKPIPITKDAWCVLSTYARFLKIHCQKIARECEELMENMKVKPCPICGQVYDVGDDHPLRCGHPGEDEDEETK